MITKRIIPCLDCDFVKGNSVVVKGKKFENLQTVGKPWELAEKYYKQGADEIVFLDVSASKQGRKNMYKVVKKTTRKVFVPITLGGGIKSVKDATKAFKSGADKVSINTAAIERPELINEISETFGKQACVVAIDAKKRENTWECSKYG